MKRDTDLIRLILLRAEELPPPPWGFNEVIEIPGYQADVIGEHIRCLADDGLLVPNDCSSQDRVDVRIERMTNAGHDLLASMRDESVWRNTKSKFGPALGTVSLKVLGDVLGQMAKDVLFGRT